MAKLSTRLKRALESDCAEDLGAIIQAKRKTDFDGLRQLVSSEPSVDAISRKKAIYALGRWGDTKVVADILRVMPDLDESGLLTAIDALGRLGTSAALDGVLPHVDNPSFNVRKFAVRALGRFDAPEAQAKLAKVQQKDPDELLRNLARKYVDQGLQQK